MNIVDLTVIDRLCTSLPQGHEQRPPHVSEAVIARSVLRDLVAEIRHLRGRVEQFETPLAPRAEQ